MSCGKVVEKGAGTLHALGVSATQAKALWAKGRTAKVHVAQTWELLPRCPACRHWVSPRTGVCNFKHCPRKGRQVAPVTDWPPADTLIVRSKDKVQRIREAMGWGAPPRPLSFDELAAQAAAQARAEAERGVVETLPDWAVSAVVDAETVGPAMAPGNGGHDSQPEADVLSSVPSWAVSTVGENRPGGQKVPSWAVTGTVSSVPAWAITETPENGSKPQVGPQLAGAMTDPLTQQPAAASVIGYQTVDVPDWAIAAAEVADSARWETGFGADADAQTQVELPDQARREGSVFLPEREPAIASGRHVDVSDLASECDFKWPVAITAGVQRVLDEIPPRSLPGETPKGRLTDVLNMARVRIQTSGRREPDEPLFYRLILNHGRRKYANLRISMEVTADWMPALLISLADEGLED